MSFKGADQNQVDRGSDRHVLKMRIIVLHTFLLIILIFGMSGNYFLSIPEALRVRKYVLLIKVTF